MENIIIKKDTKKLSDLIFNMAMRAKFNMDYVTEEQLKREAFNLSANEE